MSTEFGQFYDARLLFQTGPAPFVAPKAVLRKIDRTLLDRVGRATGSTNLFFAAPADAATFRAVFHVGD
jgi:hypothetical protein